MVNAALVLEGGSQKNAFTAGVLDYLMEKNIVFPYVVSVSEGVSNAFCYITNQIGRTKTMLHNLAVSSKNILSVFDIKNYLSNIKDYFNSKIESEIVLTNCLTGQAEYFSDKYSIEMLSKIGMAANHLPIITPPTDIDGKPFLGGSISDSIPFKRAIEKGYKKNIIITTKECENNIPLTSNLKALYTIAFRKYPSLLKSLLNHSNLYSKQQRQIKSLEKKGQAFVIRPEMKLKGENSLFQLYKHGYETAAKQFKNIEIYLSN